MHGLLPGLATVQLPARALGSGAAVRRGAVAAAAAAGLGAAHRPAHQVSPATSCQGSMWLTSITVGVFSLPHNSPLRRFDYSTFTRSDHLRSRLLLTSRRQLPDLVHCPKVSGVAHQWQLVWNALGDVRDVAVTGLTLIVGVGIMTGERARCFPILLPLLLPILTLSAY